MTTVLESLNTALIDAMRDERVVLLGEDILDPYGGAFKVTRGCSTAYPERTMSTPISESAMLGIAGGLALAGKLPVVEVMFGDFITLMADQLINHSAKFRWMYNGTAKVPLTLRAPMGGRRGYGPTHSQSLEKHFLGVPGLNVYAPNALTDPGKLLSFAIFKDEDPSLFVEHKLLYLKPILEENRGEMIDLRVEPLDSNGFINRVSFSGVKPVVSVLTYGYNFEIARDAMMMMAYEREIFIEIILFDLISPISDLPKIAKLIRSTKLVTLEEGVVSNGWGAEITSTLLETQPGFIISRVGSLALPVANSKSLEDEILPSKEKLIKTILRYVD
ncbi:MAG TPA: transketolase C-terminal domain-containing protein [Anaerolineales bacterium]|nr:transketolase C-terminal domain-containing protein [Anaerolineales bacterium]